MRVLRRATPERLSTFSDGEALAQKPILREGVTQAPMGAAPRALPTLRPLRAKGALDHAAEGRYIIQSHDNSKSPQERNSMTGMLKRTLLATLAVAAGACAAHAQEVTVKVGTVRSISTVSILWAVEKGYFNEFGIKVVNENLDTAANSIALLAQNQFQLVEGGISAGYFNGLEKNLPITMVLDRVSSPLGHNLMLRPDHKGKITELKQLKGKTIATNGQGAVSTYEVGKMLETAGLTINDVDIKVIPFTQYALAFNNKAIDAAITIPPFTAQLLSGGHAVNFVSPDDLVKPHPLTIAVSMVNTDFAKSHQEMMRNYYVAYLRGIRDYCQAYHGGSIRQAMIDLSIKTGTETRAELLHKYPWPARSPNGQINTASLLDMNAWFVKNKMSNKEFPADRIVDKSYIDYALAKLGPFVLENKDSKLEGCR
jgi:NitT/TauT family transport system substrate-binding protein